MLIQQLCLFVALGASALRKAGAVSHCDPSDKDEHCAPKPGFASKTSFDFAITSWDDDFEDFWSVDGDSSEDRGRVDFDTDDKGVALGIWEEDQAPTLTSRKYLFFGQVNVEVQAAPGRGVITAIVLKSDSGDEIDWEILGAHDKQAQTNYFYDGNALFNTYNDTHDVDSSVFSEFHSYGIEWTETKLAFSIDGTIRKTWHVGEIPPEKWPQTPMQVKLRIWPVVEGGDPGEIAWAGGLPKWDNAPFRAYYRKFEIEDYAGHCKTTDGPVEYAYDERMQGWEDVKVSGCKTRMAPGMNTPHAPTFDEDQAAPTHGSYPQPSGGAATTGGSAGRTPSAGDGTTKSGAASSTSGDAALPKETGDHEDGAPDALNEASLTLMALALVICVVL